MKSLTPFLLLAAALTAAIPYHTDPIGPPEFYILHATIARGDIEIGAPVSLEDWSYVRLAGTRHWFAVADSALDALLAATPTAEPATYATTFCLQFLAHSPMAGTQSKILTVTVSSTTLAGAKHQIADALSTGGKPVPCK